MGNPVRVNVAVSAIIVKKENGVTKVLLVQQARPENKKGLWGLPGGKVDEGESFGEALTREILEEVGIDKGSYGYEFLKIVHNIPNTTCKHIFTIDLISDVDIKTDPAEIMEARWIDTKLGFEDLKFRAEWVYPLLKSHFK